MTFLRFSPSLLLGLTLLFSTSSILGQNIKSFLPSQPTTFLSNLFVEIESPGLSSLSASAIKFSNPTLKGFENGCVLSNLDRERFAGEIPADQRILFCNAFQMVSDELNSTNWSPELRDELQKIWQVFLNENVKIRPMRKGIPRQIALAAEPFTRGGGHDFSASVYIRPQYADQKVFFLLAMHELRHIYDFYTLWETGSALPEAELEKRGFRIMGRIARETDEREKFRRLPKVWNDSWARYEQTKIDSNMEQTIEKFMKRSSFYKARLQQPSRYVISFQGRRNVRDQSQMASVNKQRSTAKKGAALENLKNQKPAVANNWREFEAPPKLVRREPKPEAISMDSVAVSPNAISKPIDSKKIDLSGSLPKPIETKLSQKGLEPVSIKASFETAKAKDPKSSENLLSAALSNEKLLYYKMNEFKYDEDFELQCWKKQKVTDRYSRKRTVSRTSEGKAFFENENISKLFRKANAAMPDCILNLDAVSADASETFWSASYLEDMPVKFDYFTTLNGEEVARYTVYKPAQPVFDAIARKYPHISNFRVFVGTIFVSVKESQIIKFWGSTFPDEATTGNKSQKTLANYNSTAIRKRLESGIWVTTEVNTVAVAEKKGKMKPFRYAVKYDNYRKAGS